jgi:hypothetical protein
MVASASDIDSSSCYTSLSSTDEEENWNKGKQSSKNINGLCFTAQGFCGMAHSSASKKSNKDDSGSDSEDEVGGMEAFWLIDSGSSSHMTGDRSWFSSLTPVMTKEYITFGDNGKGRVLSVGTVKVSESVTLWRVSLLNSLGYNLLFVSQLLDEGFEVHFKTSCSRVLDSRGDHVCTILPEGQIFRADFSQCVGSSCCLVAGVLVELWKWHRRLGHLSLDLLSCLSGLRLVRGLP